MQAPGPWDFHYREVWCVPRNGVGQTRQLGFTRHTQHHRIFFQPKEGRAQARLRKLGTPGAVLSYTSAVGPGGLRPLLQEREVPTPCDRTTRRGARHIDTGPGPCGAPGACNIAVTSPIIYLQIPRNLAWRSPPGQKELRLRGP